jgi:hypothetical protein
MSTMAADSTFDDTDSLPEAREDDSHPLLAKSAPLPPRPAKKAGRVSSSSSLVRAQMPAGDLFDSAPATPIRSQQQEPVVALESVRLAPASDRRSYRPEESFEDLDSDLSDRAPSAPVTPWRGIAPTPAKSSEPKPSAVAAPGRVPLRMPLPMPREEEEEADASPPVGLLEEEHEDTIVGEVPRKLLELSSSGGVSDENTRAYTAPQELIELAKRKREARLKASAAVAAPPEAHSRETARPPGQRRGLGNAAVAQPFELVVPRAGALPAEGASSYPPESPEGDAAPAVARDLSGPPWGEDPAGPSAAVAPKAGGSSLLELARATNELVDLDSAPAVNDSVPAAEPGPASVADSAPSTPEKRVLTSKRLYLLLVALFIVTGFLLSRSNGLHIFR